MSLGSLEHALLSLTAGGCSEEWAEQAAKGTGPSEFVKYVLHGHFRQVLSHEVVRELLVPTGSDVAASQTATEFYNRLGERLRLLVHAAVESNDTQKLHTVLLSGISCLFIFTQHNLTGPYEPQDPSPLALLAPHLASIPAASSTEAAPSVASGIGEDSVHPHERWAWTQLQVDGEDVLGKCTHVQHLLLAQAALLQPLVLLAQRHQQQQTGQADDAAAADGAQQQQQQQQQQHEGGKRAAAAVSLHDGCVSHLMSHLPSWAWWALRCVALHQHVLHGRSATLLHTSGLLAQQLLQWAGSANGSGQQQQQPGAPLTVSRLADQPSLLATLYMELALLHYSYGYVEPGLQMLREAGDVLGLQVELTGALGKRTAHQIDAKAQLVVVAARGRVMPQEQQDTELGELGLGILGGSTASAGGGGSSAAQAGGRAGAGLKETEGLVDDSDVFMAPQLIGEEGQVLDSRYHGAEQALLLGWATHVRKGTSADELQQWQMAPYVEAVLMQPRSAVMLQAVAHLLKARHEKSRARTRERALLHVEQLLEALQARQQQQQQQPAAAGATADAGALQRLRYCYAVWFPVRVALRKELAEQYLGLGFVGAALSALEELELWDAVIACYRLLDKRNIAEEIIHRRLKVTPNDASLWCALGDLQQCDDHYVTGWERSGRRHARSKRSLGHSAVRRKDYAAAAEHYEAALAINPLNPDAWFSLGYAYLKLQQAKKAIKAFCRVTQQQPDHGEAWNNIAALWQQLGRHKEAYNALQECTRHKRDNWQIWENYAQVALDAGVHLQAARGLAQVMSLTGGSRLKCQVLAGLLDHLQAASAGGADQATAAAAQEQQDEEDEEEDALDVGAEIAGFVMGLPQLALPKQQQQQQQQQQDGEGAADGSAGSGAPAVDAEARAREQLTSAVGSLLKQAVNAQCCTPEVWGLLARYYGLVGEIESQKEALLKQVRALTGTSYKSDEAKFVEVADASLALCRAYVASYHACTARAQQAQAEQQNGGAQAAAPSGMAGVRELAAARMHLRGILKQTEGTFGEHAKWQALEALLKEITAVEDKAVAAAKAAAASS